MINLLLYLVFSFFLSFVLSDVVIVTESNFNETIKTGKWILEFYAPWCPHCQKLEPILHEASLIIDQASLNLRFGTIDCTIETGLATSLDIQGYPTLKYSSSGKFIEYYGGRSVADFIDFAKKLQRPAVETITSTSLDKFTSKHVVTFVLIGKDEDKEIITDFTELWRIYPHLGFAYSSEANIINRFTNHTKLPSLIVLNDDPFVKCEIFSGEHPWNKTDVQTWMESRAFPTLCEFELQNWRPITHNGKLTVVTLIEPNMEGEYKEVLNLMRNIASEYKNKYSFGWFNVSKYSRIASQFRFSSYPACVVYDVPKDIFYANYSLIMTDLEIKQFLEKVDMGLVQGRGSGSGFLGKLEQIGWNFIWQVNDHPYFFGGIFLFFLIFILLICYVGGTVDDEDEIEIENTDHTSIKNKPKID